MPLISKILLYKKIKGLYCKYKIKDGRTAIKTPETTRKKVNNIPFRSLKILLLPISEIKNGAK